MDDDEEIVEGTIAMMATAEETIEDADGEVAAPGEAAAAPAGAPGTAAGAPVGWDPSLALAVQCGRGYEMYSAIALQWARARGPARIFWDVPAKSSQCSAEELL